MHILLLNKYTPAVTGGVEAHVGTLSRELANSPLVSGITVIGFQPRRSANCPTPSDGKTRITALPMRGRLGSAPLGWGMMSALRRTRADLVHLHVPSGLPELVWLWSRDRRPLVVTYHASAGVGPARLGYRAMLICVLARAARIIVTSPNMVRPGSEVWAFRDKVTVVPLGVDPEPWLPTPERGARAAQLRMKLAPGGEPIVLFVGRLVRYKGLDALLAAIPTAEHKAGRAARWVVVGEGPEKPHLQRLARSLGIADRVHFAGALRQEDLVAHYHAADVFVLPSVTPAEAFGLVQVEAQLAGLPVVSTYLPTGVPYVNQDGRTGIVVPPRSPEALAQALGKLLADGEARRQMGEAGRARALEHFTAGRMAQQVLAVYREVLGGGKSSARRP